MEILNGIFTSGAPLCDLLYRKSKWVLQREEAMQQLTNESVQPSSKEPWIEFDTRHLRAKHSNPLLEPKQKLNSATVLHVYQHLGSFLKRNTLIKQKINKHICYLRLTQHSAHFTGPDSHKNTRVYESADEYKILSLTRSVSITESHVHTFTVTACKQTLLQHIKYY